MNFEFKQSLSNTGQVLKNGIKYSVKVVKEGVQTGLCRLHLGLSQIAQKGYDAALKELDDAPSEYEVCSDDCSECIKESQCNSLSSNQTSKVSKASKVYQIDAELVDMVKNMEITLDEIMQQDDRPRLNKSNAFVRPS